MVGVSKMLGHESINVIVNDYIWEKIEYYSIIYILYYQRGIVGYL